MIDGKPNRSVGSPYTIWKNLKARCTNSKNTSFHLYGGRGISFDRKWTTFKGFWKDMCPSYVTGYSIDRIDNNKGYSKSNCRWIPRNKQSENRRFNNYFTLNGKTQSLAAWTKELGLNYDLIRSRTVRYKRMSFEEAIEKPSRGRKRKVQQFGLDGELIREWNSIKEAANKIGVDSSNITRAAQGATSHCGNYVWKYI